MIAAKTARISSRVVSRRGFHVSSIARGDHIENKVPFNMPFNYTNRRTFAVKYVSYFALGFSLPFVAMGWQFYKARS